MGGEHLRRSRGILVTKAKAQRSQIKRIAALHWATFGSALVMQVKCSEYYPHLKH